MSIFNDILQCNLEKMKHLRYSLYGLWIEQMEWSEVSMKSNEL